MPADTDFDEDSVFNRLFTKKEPARRSNSVENFERIFADIRPPAEVIRVRDFLPNYNDKEKSSRK